MEYKEFKELYRDMAKDSAGVVALRNFISKFEELGLEDGIKHFYPKGTFLYDELTLYYFYEDKTVIVEFEGEFNVNLTSISNDKIGKLEFSFGSNSYMHRTLKIHYDSEVISFTSTEDTNSSWAGRFAETIEEIFKYLN
jgi:hypothetical protein